MTKVKCNVCLNENNKFCTIKKVKVHINKKRKCEFYIYDSSKLKIKQKIPSIRLNYVEQQKAKQKTKEQLKELKKLINSKSENNIAQHSGLINSNIKHPLTGDLSRFTTTATKGK